MDDICTACLCKGRKLHFVGETGFHHLYAQILNEIPICDLSSVCIRVCWECRAALHRCHMFKERVKTSYNTLLQHLTEPTLKLPTSHPHLQIHRVSITTYPDIKSEPDVSSDVTESVSKPQTNADLKGDVRPQFNVDLIHGDVRPQFNVDLIHCDVRPQFNVDLIHGDVRPQFNVDLIHGDVRPQFNVGVEFEVDCIKDEESDLHCEPETFVNDLERVGKRTRSKKEKENKKSNVKKKKAKVKSKKKKAKEASDSESIRDYAEEIEGEGEEKETVSRETGEKQEALSLKESPVQTLVPKAKTKRAPRVSGAAPERPQCVECGKMFSSKKTYRYHLNVLHKGQNRYPCPRCGKVYQWKSNLGRHLRSHTARDSGELYCAPCDKRFSSVATHRQHLRVARRHVSESEFSFMCNECGKKFVSKTRLRDHIDWEHLHKIKFTCQLCNKPFKCHTSLYVHLQNVHRNKEKRDNLCHVCGKSYQNAAKLKYHIVAMHTHETPYQCGECGAAFGWYSSLYRHVREVHYKMKLQPNKKPKRSKRPDCPPPALAPPPHPAQTPHPAQG